MTYHLVFNVWQSRCEGENITHCNSSGYINNFKLKIYNPHTNAN